MTLDTTNAEEFLEVYKGVVPEYSVSNQSLGTSGKSCIKHSVIYLFLQAMVVQLTSGPLLAIELIDTNNPACTQETFRKLAGPADPVCIC